MKRALSKRKSAVLEVLSKPKIPSEIREQMGLKRSNNISSTIKQLVGLKLIYCLTPKAKVGKLYGLINKGKKLRKKILLEKGLPFSYVQPPDVNWQSYGWIVCGKQRKAILKAMKMPLPLKYIKERAQAYNRLISRMNTNDILQLFVKKRIAVKIWRGNRVIFRLTKIGEKIRNQLFEP
jgi:DNA-binding MarR family transcriptional regulator